MSSKGGVAAAGRLGGEPETAGDRDSESVRDSNRVRLVLACAPPSTIYFFNNKDLSDIFLSGSEC